MRGSLTSSRLVLFVLGAIVVVAAGVGIWYATGGSGGSGGPVATAATTQASTPALSHRQYALLYLGAILHKTHISVLDKWPKPAYQHYRSGSQDCYEWWDKPIALYNLCFENGVLTIKAIE